jgi:hypothetical protein
MVYFDALHECRARDELLLSKEAKKKIEKKKKRIILRYEKAVSKQKKRTKQPAERMKKTGVVRIRASTLDKKEREQAWGLGNNKSEEKTKWSVNDHQ